MNINKHFEFFNPTDIDCEIHVIGCGAIGSHIAEQIARLGIDDNIHLWDLDTVEAHNIANQNFEEADIEQLKDLATAQHMQRINPDIKIINHSEGWSPEARLSGWIFLCVDNIDIRRAIIQDNLENPYIKGYCDIRMGLTDGQCYFVKADNKKHIEELLGTMNFSHEEAKDNVPVSACGLTLSVIPTIKLITAVAISNWINCLKDKTHYNFIMSDAFNFILDKFQWKS